MPDGRQRWVRLAVRLAVFAALGLFGLRLFGTLIYFLSGNLLVTSALAVFLAAGIANAALMRIYERAGLSEVGFAWNPAGRRNLLLGLAGGAGAATLVLGGALVTPAAELEAAAAQTAWPSWLFVAVLLLFGAVGEEMLFHGYGFQRLLAALGPFATILPVSALFALAHSGNLNITPLGMVNTFGWGVLLGYAFWRSRDLWLPIGLHLGWNWMLPLFGAPLSGFTMSVTGYAIRWRVGPLWSGGDYGPEASVLTTAVLILLFVAVRHAPVQPQEAFLLRARTEG